MTTDEDICVIGYRKNDERYVVLYKDGQEEDARVQFILWAANPQLEFDWNDFREVLRGSEP